MGSDGNTHGAHDETEGSSDKSHRRVSGRGGIPGDAPFRSAPFWGNSGRRSKSARLFREVLESSTRRRRRDEEHQDLTTTTRRGTPRHAAPPRRSAPGIQLGPKERRQQRVVANFPGGDAQVRPGTPRGGDGARGAVRRSRGGDPFPRPRGTAVSDAVPSASYLVAPSGLFVKFLPQVHRFSVWGREPSSRVFSLWAMDLTPTSTEHGEAMSVVHISNTISTKAASARSPRRAGAARAAGAGRAPAGRREVRSDLVVFRLRRGCCRAQIPALPCRVWEMVQAVPPQAVGSDGRKRGNWRWAV